MRTYEVVDPKTKKLVGLFHQSWEPKPASPPPVTTQRQSQGCPHCPHCQQLAAHQAGEGPTDSVDWGEWKADTSYEGPCRDSPAGW
jgi:hypothetical protein